MDDGTTNLVVQLCTWIGMIMEDASPVALTIAGLDFDAHQAALTELAQAIERASSLVATANALHD